MTPNTFSPHDVRWERPEIDRSVLKGLSRRSDARGLYHCIGVLAILTLTGLASYIAFRMQLWVLMAICLYVHGAVFAFNPQTHELAHGSVFETQWLNKLFSRVFGLLHWESNAAHYWMSHKYHHRYTLHKSGDGEVEFPSTFSSHTVVRDAVNVVEVGELLRTVYDTIYSIIVPYNRNPFRSPWERYVYAQSTEKERANAFWTRLSQFGFHVAFAVVAIWTGNWFLIVVVSLPAFYGGRWYHRLIHDTMHAGRPSETSSFRECCRTIRLDPISSFLYWHMEWHTEHHTFPVVPCYNLRKLHKAVAGWWEPPQTVAEAWRQIDREARSALSIQQ